MIKRLFYRVEHADRDDAADSSSSSDSEIEADATEESEDNAVAEVKESDEPRSTSSGHESEDSSADEINASSPGVLNEDDAEIKNDRQLFVDNHLSSKRCPEETKSNIKAEKVSVPADFPDCVLQIKSVFRCRICPRILCLTEETMRAHLNSKRHTRSEKLLKEHRLKAILNDDGEIENQETAAEMHARIVALAQPDKPAKKNKRRPRKRNLSTKEKVHENLTKKIAKQSTHSPAKKRRKSEN